MQLIRIFNKKNHYYDQFIHLYKTSFPLDEQNPVSLMFNLSKKNKFFIYAIIDNNQFIGLVVIAASSKWHLLNYLAIEPNYQGKGYGSKICALLNETYRNKNLVMEVEQNNPNELNSMQQRRLDFYIKNHFTYSGLATSLYGVSYELLTNNKSLDYSEYIAMYQQIFGALKVKFLRIYEIESKHKKA